MEIFRLELEQNLTKNPNKIQIISIKLFLKFPRNLDEELNLEANGKAKESVGVITTRKATIIGRKSVPGPSKSADWGEKRAVRWEDVDVDPDHYRGLPSFCVDYLWLHSLGLLNGPCLVQSNK